MIIIELMMIVIILIVSRLSLSINLVKRIIVIIYIIILIILLSLLRLSYKATFSFLYRIHLNRQTLLDLLFLLWEYLLEILLFLIIDVIKIINIY